jgi:hypothetical protein
MRRLTVSAVARHASAFVAPSMFLCGWGKRIPRV